VSLEERTTIIYNRNKRESTLEEKRKIYRTGTIIIHTTRTFMPIVAITDTRKHARNSRLGFGKRRTKRTQKRQQAFCFRSLTHNKNIHASRCHHRYSQASPEFHVSASKKRGTKRTKKATSGILF
jgi:hypothetical protein